MHYYGLVSRKRIVASFCLQGFTSLTFQCHFDYMRKINGLIFEESTAEFPMLRKYTIQVQWPWCSSKEKYPFFLKELILLVWINGMHGFCLCVCPVLRKLDWFLVTFLWCDSNIRIHSFCYCNAKGIWVNSIEISLHTIVWSVSVHVHICVCISCRSEVRV